MGKTVDDPWWNRGYREYFWFAAILPLLISTAVRQTASSRAPDNSSLTTSAVGSQVH
jgi:hypothetical protein